MRVRLVTALREFDDLAPLWREITTESGQTSPFLSHDWFACCWRTAGPSRRREVWVLENSRGPVALIPLLHRWTRVRGLPARLLEFLQSRDTPLADIPAAGALDEIVAALFAALRARRDWDIFSLPKLPAQSSTLKALAAALPGQFAWRVAGTEYAPYLDIAGTWEALLRGKTQRFRKTCRNIENRMRRHGEISLEEHRDVDPDGPLFAEVMDVSRLSWKGPQGLAMATMEGMPRFFRELTRRASANGWLRLWILRLDGRAVATEYQIAADGRVHALRADFDSALSELSPGAYLNMRIIESLFERRDARQYDMGPGTNDYKVRWATGMHEAVALEVYAPTPYGRLLHAIETRLVPLARRWRAQRRAQCA